MNPYMYQTGSELNFNNIQQSREDAIQGLLDQDIPAEELLNYLNYSENGEEIGDFTEDEIQNYLNQQQPTNDDYNQEDDSTDEDNGYIQYNLEEPADEEETDEDEEDIEVSRFGGQRRFNDGGTYNGFGWKPMQAQLGNEGEEEDTEEEEPEQEESYATKWKKSNMQPKEANALKTTEDYISLLKEKFGSGLQNYVKRSNEKKEIEKGLGLKKDALLSARYGGSLKKYQGNNDSQYDAWKNENANKSYLERYNKERDEDAKDYDDWSKNPKFQSYLDKYNNTQSNTQSTIQDMSTLKPGDYRYQNGIRVYNNKDASNLNKNNNNNTSFKGLDFSGLDATKIRGFKQKGFNFGPFSKNKMSFDYDVNSAYNPTTTGTNTVKNNVTSNTVNENNYDVDRENRGGLFKGLRGFFSRNDDSNNVEYEKKGGQPLAKYQWEYSEYNEDGYDGSESNDYSVNPAKTNMQYSRMYQAPPKDPLTYMETIKSPYIQDEANKLNKLRQEDMALKPPTTFSAPKNFHYDVTEKGFNGNKFYDNTLNRFHRFTTAKNNRDIRDQEIARNKKESAYTVYGSNQQGVTGDRGDYMVNTPGMAPDFRPNEYGYSENSDYGIRQPYPIGTSKFGGQQHTYMTDAQIKKFLEAGGELQIIDEE
jgi:hypothetical protein